MMKRTTNERFWAKVEQTETCWNWTACTEAKGYGTFRYNGKMIKAHRYMYELINGPIPEGLQIDHICHNRRCVRPDHLRLVTDKQNKEHQLLSPRNTSGARGVRWDKRRHRWRAYVKHNRVIYNAGSFDKFEDAEEASRLKRNELFTHNNDDRNAAS